MHIVESEKDEQQWESKTLRARAVPESRLLEGLVITEVMLF